jgi:hypothetical protein
MNTFKNLIIISLILIFTFTLLMYNFDFHHWNGITEKDDKNNRFINRLYFVMSTLSTTGYGDVTPKTKKMKIIVMVFQFILLISLISILSENEYVNNLLK